MPSLKEARDNYLLCPNCGRMYYKADRLNVLLNLGLAVATIMLGAIGALYWLFPGDVG